MACRIVKCLTFWHNYSVNLRYFFQKILNTVDIILNPPPLGHSLSPKQGGGLSVISHFLTISRINRYLPYSQFRLKKGGLSMISTVYVSILLWFRYKQVKKTRLFKIIKYSSMLDFVINKANISHFLATLSRKFPNYRWQSTYGRPIIMFPDKFIGNVTFRDTLNFNYVTFIELTWNFDIIWDMRHILQISN